MLTIPEILPVRVFEYDSDQFAPLESRLTSEKYADTTAKKYKQPWQLDTPIVWQFQYDGDEIEGLVNGVGGLITCVDVTPIGWTGEKVWNCTFVPTVEEIVSFEFNFNKLYSGFPLAEYTVYSECVHIKESLPQSIKLNWYNSENNFDIVYGTDGDVYQGTIFVNGYMKDMQPQGVIDTMEDPDGLVLNLKSVIQKAYDFKAYLVPQWVVTQLSLVCASDRLTINETSVLFSEPVGNDVILQTNLSEVSGIATKADWNHNIAPEGNARPFITEWTVPSGNFTFPAGITTGYSGEINFGDGTGWQAFSAFNDAVFTHNYTSGGTYVIFVRGSFPWFFANNVTVAPYLDNVHEWGNVGFKFITGMFYGCTNLTTIPAAQIPADITTVTTVYRTFYNCSSLTGAVPEFSNYININNFQETYYNCSSLTGSLPDFTNNTAVTTFEGAFYNCLNITGIIPTNIFATCSLVTTFKGTFSTCSGLTGGIPDFRGNLLVSDFSQTFLNCTGLNGIITNNTFDNSTLVTTFIQTFQGCTSLTLTIPNALFSNCTLVISFGSTFRNCTSITGSIPDFSTNINVTSFLSVFNGCTGLTGTIPQFTNNTLVNDFGNCFQGCLGLTGSIPSFATNTAIVQFDFVFLGCTGLNGTIPSFAANTLITKFSSAFKDCTGLTGSVPIFTNALCTTFNNTFKGCTGLTGSIPNFSACVVVTDFSFMFWDCTGLNGTIPSTVFSGCTLVTTFNSVFRSCTSITGSIPNFSNNTLVTNFTQAFFGNTAMAGTISSFASNTAVINFSEMFDGCTALTGSSQTLWLYGNNNLIPPNYDVGTPDGLDCYRNCNLSDQASIPVYWK